MNERSVSAAIERWKNVPGEAGIMSLKDQVLQRLSLRRLTLPATIEHQVLAVVLPRDDVVVGAQHVSQIDVREPGAGTDYLGSLDYEPFLAATTKSLFLFFIFDAGLHEAHRKFLELPFDGSVQLSPFIRGHFDLSWTEGLRLRVRAGSPGITRRPPLKRFHAALSSALGGSQGA